MDSKEKKIRGGLKRGNAAVEEVRVKPEKKTRGKWAEVWRRLKKNKVAVAGLFLLVFLAIVAVFAPLVAPEGIDDQNYGRILEPPSGENLLGTDNLGRDVFSRIIYGSRISLTIGFITTSIGVVIGGILGSIAGYYGGRIDNLIMRFIDIILAIPGLLLAIALVSALGPSLTNLMIAVGIASVPQFARLVRASVLSTKENEFIEAAQCLGASDLHIIVKHIWPNSFAPVLVQATLRMGAAIVVASGLSFLGLGSEPPTPEWGALLSDGRRFLRDAWWMATFPGVAIMITVLAFNLVGDGLRDALDPRLKD